MEEIEHDKHKSYLYPFNFNDKDGSLIKLPTEIPEGTIGTYGPSPKDVFTVIMIDVSGSMDWCWKALQKAWMKHIPSVVTGPTKMYVFGEKVIFKRNSAKLKSGDFEDSSTNLSEALQVLFNDVKSCKENYVRVILITDGHHNSTSINPSKIIEQMRPLEEKTAEVYIIGVGNQFPVQYSVDIRSRLHNGPTDIPFLFWVKELEEFDEQLSQVSSEIIKSRMMLKTSVFGSLLPGSDQKNEFCLGDWIYVERPNEELRDLLITFENGSNVEVIQCEDISPDVMTSDVFSQWNSLVLQKERSNETFDPNIHIYMKKSLNKNIERQEAVNIDHLPIAAQSSYKNKLAEWRSSSEQYVAQSEQIVQSRSKFTNEADFADVLLQTTNAGKYKKKSSTFFRK